MPPFSAHETARPPRVLLIGPVPAPLGGVSVHIARLAVALARDGSEVSFLDESPVVKPDIANVRHRSPRAYLAQVWQADVVHVHSSNAALKLGHTLVARLLGRRVVVTVHSSRSGLLDRTLYRWSCRLSHRAILVSEQVRAHLQVEGCVIPAFLPPAPAEETVPNDVAAWIAARRGEGRRIIVSNASDLRDHQGHDLYGLDMLVDALARPDLAASHALVFVVASLRFGGGRFSAMQQRIAAKGLHDRILLTQLDAPFAGIIKSADIVVRATNTDGDALTVREALWYGKRTLASDCVVRPEGCELFHSRDTDDLVAKLGGAPTRPLPPGAAQPDLFAAVRQSYRLAGGPQPANGAGVVPEKRNVLVISQFYTPDITAAAFRIAESVALLTARGLEVRVITAEPHKAQAANAQAAQPADDPTIMRARIRPYRAGGGAISYIRHYLSFVVSAIGAGFRLWRSGWRADVVWVSSPPLFAGLAGIVLARLMRAPMVLDVRDIWPESAAGAGMIKTGSPMFRIGKILERLIYGQAARLTCVSQTMQAYLANASGKPVDVVFNGVDASPAPVASATIARRILYAGNLGRAQGLDALLRAFAAAREQSRSLDGWTVDLIGAGAMEADLRALAATLGVADAVHFHGVLDKAGAMAATRASAVLFINLVDDPAFALTVPSKVFDCLRAGRPILYGVGGAEARAILAESGGNLAFAPSDVASLSAALITMTADLPHFALAARGNTQIVENRFTRASATDVLAAVLHAAAWQAARAPLQRGASRLARAFAFARHVPPQRILRRLQLTAQRRLHRFWQRHFPRAKLPVPVACHPVVNPPRSLLPQRGGPTPSADRTASVTLLGQPQSLADPVAWTSTERARGDQLRFMTLNYMEFLEGADDQTFARLVTSWLDAQHPYSAGFYRETHNSYALSLRAVVWMQQLAARPLLPADLRQRMTESLAGQLHFLAANLETDIGGNHLIKNIKALLWGSAFFDGAVPTAWRQRGLALLARELPRQILPDGMHYERSPAYHNQVFADLLEIRHALGADPLAGALDRHLAGMAQAAADFTHGDGCPAQFNDAGLTMSRSAAQCLDAFARLFGTTPLQNGIFAYRNAGYFGLASRGTVFIADCGAIGPDDLPGHGHGDVLSFEWSVGAQRVIVDQGVYEYVAGPRRAASRAASHHNTLAIGGREQADFFADFRVGRRPHASVRRFETRPDGFLLEGCHEGFTPLTHSRTFDVTPARIAITDRVAGGLAVGVRTSLLLHPDVVATVMSNAGTGSLHGPVINLTAGSTRAIVQSSVLLTVEPAVWWPDMGVEIATHRIVAHWPAACAEATLTLALA